MKPKVAVIGKGNVGSALGRGLERAGYEVRMVGNDPPRVRETTAWGEIIVLAVPYLAIEQTLREMSDAADGKTLVDASNALTADQHPAWLHAEDGPADRVQAAPRVSLHEVWGLKP